MERRIVEFTRNAEISTGKHFPKIRNELHSLNDKLAILKNLTDSTRNRINSSIEYFALLDGARDWLKEGSKLLILVARSVTTVKSPEDAHRLLQSIDDFLKPGEDDQERRIEKIRELSTRVFGTDRLPQFNDLVSENREMLDSFAVVTSELCTLAENLRNAENLREKLERERDEADARLREARAEVSVAQAAAEEAEEKRRIAEMITAETIEKAKEAEEAKRLAMLEVAEKASKVTSLAVQTEREMEEPVGRVVVLVEEEKIIEEVCEVISKVIFESICLSILELITKVKVYSEMLIYIFIP